MRDNAVWRILLARLAIQMFLEEKKSLDDFAAAHDTDSAKIYCMIICKLMFDKPFDFELPLRYNEIIVRWHFKNAQRSY